MTLWEGILIGCQLFSGIVAAVWSGRGLKRWWRKWVGGQTFERTDFRAERGSPVIRYYPPKMRSPFKRPKVERKLK